MLPGVDLRFVWKEIGPITTDGGVLVLGATHTFDETPAPDVVLIGGSSLAATPATDATLLACLQQAHETSTWTTSVCTGSLALASAGLLDGKRATGHWIAHPVLSGLGAEAQRNQRIVRDGKIVTAAGVSLESTSACFLQPKSSAPILHRRSSLRSSTTRSRRSTAAIRARRRPRPSTRRPRCSHARRQESLSGTLAHSHTRRRRRCTLPGQRP